MSKFLMTLGGIAVIPTFLITIFLPAATWTFIASVIIGTAGCILEG